MDRIKDGTAALQRLNWRVIARFVTVAAIVAAIVWGCISTSNASNMRAKYAQARESVGESLYSVVYMMTLKYDDASLAGADVEGEILPAMRTYYDQALALNEAAAEAFGEKAAVLDDNLIGELDRAFGAYDDAYKAGHSTEDAAALMTQAMADTRAALEKTFDEDGKLIAD